MARTLACPRPQSSREQSTDSIYPCPRTLHVRAQSAPTGAVTTCPHPRTHHSFDSPWASIGRGNKLSADSPQSRTIHVRELVSNEHSPRASAGKKLSTPSYSGFHIVACTFPGPSPIYSLLSLLCPPLIPPQSARQSENLLPYVRRNSRTCSRRRMSSRSCDRSGHPIGPSPTCSRSTACPRARLPSPRSATRCFEKSFGHAAGPDENDHRRSLHRTANRPMVRRSQTSLIYRWNQPRILTAAARSKNLCAARVSHRSASSNHQVHETA